MKHFYGTVENNHKAEQLAAAIANELGELGGRVVVGRTFEGLPAMLLVRLPDDSTIDPNALVPDVSFTEVHEKIVPAVPDQGIR